MRDDPAKPKHGIKWIFVYREVFKNMKIKYFKIFLKKLDKLNLSQNTMFKWAYNELEVR